MDNRNGCASSTRASAVDEIIPGRSPICKWLGKSVLAAFGNRRFLPRLIDKGSFLEYARRTYSLFVDNDFNPDSI
jgi:hypothetical protein